MIASPRTLWIASIFVIVGLVACDDPSGVGLDIIDEQGGTPATTSQSLDLDSYVEPSISGGTLNVLVGHYTDPALDQEITAHGHINFFPPEEDDFEEGDEIEGASLQLNPTVSYGDTTGTIRVAVRTITSEWEAIRAASDTSVAVGEVVGEFSIPVGEAQARFDFPDTWVEQHADALQDTSLTDQFYGLQLETVSGNSIVSLRTQGTTLNLQTTGESDVPLTATPEFALTTTSSTAPHLANRHVLQNVTGHAARVSVPLADSLINHSVNRAEIELPVDTTSLTGDATVIRQEPDNLYVELSDGTRNTFVRLSRSLQNPHTFTSEGGQASIRQFFQQSFRQAETADSVRITVYPDQHFQSIVPEGSVPEVFELQLKTIPLFLSDAPDCPYTQCSPRLLLTTTPID